MKLEALDHPKTLDFASRLEVELPMAIGYLELFWAFTGKKTPQGNVGKWPDGAISMACHWRGPADIFVRALVDSGFVDRDPQYRLLVHDWADHQPNWVRAKLAKLKLPVICPDLSPNKTPENGQFVPPGPGIRSDLSVNEQGVMSGHNTTFVPTEEPSSRARVLPSEAKGSEAKTSVVSASAPEPPDSGDWEAKLQAIYPPCNGARKWIDALRSCRQQVEDGEATWPELFDLTSRYREFVDAGGVSGPRHVLTPQNFYDPRDKLWRQPRELPKSKAEKRLAGNLDAAAEFMRRTEPKQ